MQNERVLHLEGCVHLLRQTNNIILFLTTLDLTQGIKLDQEIREREKTDTEVWQSKCVTESNKLIVLVVLVLFKMKGHMK